MGACCSQPAADLEHASEADIKRLREKGHLPCLAGPSSDFDGDNQCQTIYVAGTYIQRTYPVAYCWLPMFAILSCYDYGVSHGNV